MISLPTTIRRTFASSPVLATVLTTFLLITIYTFLSPGDSLALWPSSIRDSTYGAGSLYPPEISPETIPKYVPSSLALSPLNERYDLYFDDRRLPSTFDTSLLRPLAKRLHEFLGRPGFDVELTQNRNDKRCPLFISDKLVNPDQYNGEIGWWESIGAEQIAKTRANVVSMLRNRVERGEVLVAEGDNAGAGRGIVMTGGNQDTTFRLISVLKHLQRLKVKLPIEVFHYPDELQDGGQRRELEQLGATIRQVEGVEKEAGAWKNWQIKGLAIVQSSFREVLYLDSDNTPLRDPSHLFAAPLYLNRGRAVFWPDLSKDHPANAIWRIVGKPCSLHSWTFESGQMVIDKAGNNGLNLAALIIAAEMQGQRDFWFHMCGGDKDTFRWAFEILGLQYGESPRWMSALGTENQFDGGRFCGHTVLQYDLVVPDGFTREPPLFVHSNLLKHLGGAGLHKGNLFTHVKRMSDDSAHLPTLNHARSYVYTAPVRGMCLDLEWHDNRDRLPEEERDRVKVETVPIGDIEGDVFRGFEDAFFDEGGRIGGW